MVFPVVNLNSQTSTELFLGTAQTKMPRGEREKRREKYRAPRGINKLQCNFKQRTRILSFSKNNSQKNLRTNLGERTKRGTEHLFFFQRLSSLCIHLRVWPFMSYKLSFPFYLSSSSTGQFFLVFFNFYFF